MSFESRIRPELLPGLEAFRAIGLSVQDFTAANIPEVRTVAKAAFEGAIAHLPPNLRVRSEDRLVPGLNGAPDILLRIYRPVAAQGVLPCMFWIHGGGMILAEMAFDDPDCQAYAEQVQCVVVSVEYRLAPEHPYPCGMEDCYAGLSWVAANAQDLGIDATRIAIAGRSGGACLAAATALWARDHQGPTLAYQLLIYPMLDDRNQTPSSLEFTDVVSWSRRQNLSAWSAVLGSAAGTDSVSPYAAPARAKDVSRLPPTLIQVGELEIFRDESIAYAQALMKAQVPCELHVYPGLYHGSDMFNPAAASSVEMAAERIAALKRALVP